MIKDTDNLKRAGSWGLDHEVSMRSIILGSFLKYRCFYEKDAIPIGFTKREAVPIFFTKREAKPGSSVGCQAKYMLGARHYYDFDTTGCSLFGHLRLGRPASTLEQATPHIIIVPMGWLTMSSAMPICLLSQDMTWR